MALANPPIDIRRFQDIVDEAKKKIPAYFDGWTDHNVSDRSSDWRACDHSSSLNFRSTSVSFIEVTSKSAYQDMRMRTVQVS